MVLQRILMVLLDLLAIAAIGFIGIKGWRLYLDTKAKYTKSLYRSDEKRERKMVSHGEDFDITGGLSAPIDNARVAEKESKSNFTSIANDLMERAQNEQLVEDSMIIQTLAEQEQFESLTGSEIPKDLTSDEKKSLSDYLHDLKPEENKERAGLGNLGLFVQESTGEIVDELPPDAVVEEYTTSNDEDLPDDIEEEEEPESSSDYQAEQFYSNQATTVEEDNDDLMDTTSRYTNSSQGYAAGSSSTAIETID